MQPESIAPLPTAEFEELKDIPDDLEEEDDDYEQVFKQPAEDREAIKQLLDTFDDSQSHRYEAYRRAHFSKASIKKTVQNITGNQVTSSVSIIIAGVSKVFVGEIIELALEVMEERNEEPPLRPAHLREALERYREVKNRVPNPGYKTRLF